MSTKAGLTGRTLARLFLESLPALLVASAYTFWSRGSADHPVAASDLVGRFGAAFFFVMWIVGQYLRVSKQLGVDAYLTEIRDGVNHIKGAMWPTAAPSPGPSPATDVARPALPEPSPATDVARRALLTEADGALESGHPRAALTLAGAALEEGLREFGRVRGLAGADRASPMELLREIDRILPSRDAQRIRSLWELRNRAVHGRIEEHVAGEKAADVLAQIRTLTEALRTVGDPVTGIPCPRCKRPTMGSGGAVNTCGHCGFTMAME